MRCPPQGSKANGMEGMNDALFCNIDNPVGGISRLGGGIDTNIFVGDGATVSLVEAGPNAKASIYDHPEEHWGVLLKGGTIRIETVSNMRYGG